MNVTKGIDISYHQGDINFELVKKSGIEFVIIREGYRDTTDKKFFEYVKGAIDAGIRILGVYHFSYALNEEEAKKEADYCVSNLMKAGLDKNTLIFYDFEYDTVKKAALKGVVLGPVECNKHTRAFCERVIELGYYRPGIYTNDDYRQNWYEPVTINKYFLWLADYSGSKTSNCLIRQYSDKGVVPGINGAVDLNYYYEENFKMERKRTDVVDLAHSWLGKKESDGSYKEIIDIYNSFSGKLPRGIKMDYSWPWCACTWSALAIALGYTDIMPIEISCGELIEQAKTMECWQENDGYIPYPGDGVLYDWDDKGVGDNVGWPDHVGTVDYCNENSGYFTVVEGNYSDSVKKRTVSINGKYIRGFITPKYTNNDSPLTVLEPNKDISTIAREVIVGLWGIGDVRKKSLEMMGYDYTEVQSKVNEILNGPSDKQPITQTPSGAAVESSCYAKSFDSFLAGTYTTTADLYCRNDAGTNKKALCLIPKGTKVQCYGYYTEFNGTKWLSITFTFNKIKYTGFSSSKYLKK